MGFWDSMTGQQIYENFANAAGPAGLMETQQHLAVVGMVYLDRENQIKALAASMEEGWTGDASGAAQRGAGPLAVAHGGAAQEMATANELLERQAGSFFAAKNTVVPVPPAPAEPPLMTNIVTNGSAQVGYAAAMSKTNQAAQANVAAMDGWTSASSYNGTMMPTEYGHIDPNAMNVSMTETKAPPPIIHVDHGTGAGRAATGGEGSGGAATMPVGDTARTTSAGAARTAPSGPDSGATVPDREGTTPGRFQPAAGTGLPGATGWQSDRTRTAPGTESPVLGGIGGIGSGGSGGGSAGSGSGSTGGRLSGTGGNGSAADRLTGARGTGAGTPGAAGEPVGRGGTGTAGAKGAGGRQGGMPGMGGGRKGDGGEDEEHQRKYVVDNDTHFQLTDEDGEKVVDPRTGLPPTPPVIGT